MKYKISQITTYNEDKELYGTYIGYDKRGLPLFCTVWGNTEAQSRNKAKALAILLESAEITVHP